MDLAFTTSYIVTPILKTIISKWKYFLRPDVFLYSICNNRYFSRHTISEDYIVNISSGTRNCYNITYLSVSLIWRFSFIPHYFLFIDTYTPKSEKLIFQYKEFILTPSYSLLSRWHSLRYTITFHNIPVHYFTKKLGGSSLSTLSIWWWIIDR